jgi:hypothetical protein
VSADVTDGEQLGDLELVNWVGGHSSLGLSVSRFLADRVERSVALGASEPLRLLRHHARRPHHIDHAGGKAKQQEYDEAPGRGRQQAIEPPAESRSAKNTRNQFGGETKPDGHGGCPGLGRVLLVSGMVSPDFAVAPNFGQPVVKTSEPCRKRSFVGRRMIAISTSAAVRVFSHAEEIKRCRDRWKLRRHP